MTRYVVTVLVAGLLVAASPALNEESTHELMAFKKKKP